MQSWATRLSILISILILLNQTSCKRKILRSEAGYVIGDSNEIELLDKKNERQVGDGIIDATVVISTTLASERKKFCSGVFIRTEEGKAGILTNFHCFADSKDGKVSSNFLPEACVNTVVFFGFTKANHDEVVPRKCESGTLTGDHDGDLAFFKLVNQDDIIATQPTLELWNEDTIPDDRDAYIIHHPDIAANYFTVGSEGYTLPAAAVTSTNCHTLGNFTTQEWPLDPSLAYSVKHTCDLVHGSSGSPLIDKNTDKVLGVNWGGIEISYKKSSETVNSATKGSYINAFLSGNTTKIRQESEDIRKQELAKQKQDKDRKSPVSCGAIAGATPGSLLLLLLLPLFITPLVVLTSAWRR